MSTLPNPIDISLHDFARAFRFGVNPLFNFRTLPPKFKNLAPRTEDEKERFKKAKRPYEAWLQSRCEPYGVDAYSHNRDLALDLLQDEKKRDTLKEIRRANREADASAVYFVVNQGGQKKADIKQFTAFYGEWDDIPLEEQWARVMALPIPPHVINKARASLHFYWLADEETTAEEWLTVQRTLIVMCGSDMAICDLPRVMRVPDYDHTTLDFETGEMSRVGVTCLKFDTGERLSARAMLEMLETVGQASVSKDEWKAYAKTQRAKNRKAAGLPDVEKASPIWQGEAPAELKARFEAMLESLEVWGPYEDGFRSTCPGCHHPNPSLVSSLGSDRIFHYCFAECEFEQICDGGGWSQSDCFAKPPAGKPKPQPAPVGPGGEYIPYEIRHGKLIWLKPKSGSGEVDGVYEPVTLTNFTAEITGDVLRDDGTEPIQVFEVEVTVIGNGGPHKGTVKASEFSGMRWPVAIAGAKAVIYAGKVEHTRAAVQLLSDDIKVRRVVAHTGWRTNGDEYCFFHAGGAIGAEGLVPADVELPPALTPCSLPAPPTGDRLREVVRAVTFDLPKVAHDRISLPLTGAVFVAALTGGDFSLFLLGTTGKGKTELLILAQSFFGKGFDEKHIPSNWGSTPYSIQGITHLAKDIICGVDDFVPKGTQIEQAKLHAKAETVLRGQANSSGRARCNPDGSVRPERPPRGLIIATGEDIPRGQSLIARLLAIEVKEKDVDWAQLTLCQKRRREGLFAEATSAFLQWLATDSRIEKLRKEQADKIHELREGWSKTGLDIHKKVANTLAQIERAWGVWLKFAEECGAIDEDEATRVYESVVDALDVAGREQTKFLANENPATRFIELLKAAIRSGRAHIASAADEKTPAEAAVWGWEERFVTIQGDSVPEWAPKGDKIGWLNCEGVYLQPDAAYKMAQSMGVNGEGLTISSQTLWKRLKEEGLLVTEGSRETNKVRRRVNGNYETVIHVNSACFLPRD